MADDSATSFARETWALYAVGLVIVCLRYIARLRRFGITGLKLDDYLMANGVVWYTILCVAFNRIMSGGGSNLLTADDIAALTPATIAERVSGSKWVFVSEHAMILTIWSTKVCMLILYMNITENLKERKWVNLVAVYTALSFLGSELALFLICRPINQYWAVPAENPQCSTYQYYEIVQGSLSIPGDIAILAIGIPILVSIRLPLQQKAILVMVFGMGFFVIVAAILTKVYCLVPALISYVYMNWYFREASVAMYVTNLPTVWPLLRDVFPYLKTWGSRSRSKIGNTSTERQWAGASSHARINSNSKNYPMKTYNKKPSDSQEAINDSDSGKSLDPRTLEIQRDVTFTVQSELVGGGAPGHAASEAWDKQHVTTVVTRK